MAIVPASCKQSRIVCAEVMRAARSPLAVGHSMALIAATNLHEVHLDNLTCQMALYLKIAVRPTLVACQLARAPHEGAKGSCKDITRNSEKYDDTGVQQAKDPTLLYRKLLFFFFFFFFFFPDFS